MRQVIFYMMLITLLGCSKRAGDGGKETSDEDSQTTPTEHGSDTATPGPDSLSESDNERPDTGADSATGDTDTLSDVQYGEPELLYDFPVLEGEGGGMFHMDVDDTYVYYSTMTNLYRADKEGGGEPEYLVGSPLMGGVHQNLYVDSDAIYWVSNNFLGSLDLITNERTSLTYAEDGEEVDMDVLTLDEDRIYLAGPACEKIISISKDGGDRIVSEQHVEGEVGPITTLALDDEFVYCGGGHRGSSMGKLFRCPKEGGEITEVTSLPELYDPDISWAGPEVTGMALTEDRVYMLSEFGQGGNIEYFGYVPTSGGEYARIAELQGISNTQRLFHDEKRNALYFFAQGGLPERGVYKYDLADNELTHLTIEGGEEPMAADEDYLYWHDRSKIYRMKKF